MEDNVLIKFYKELCGIMGIVIGESDQLFIKDGDKNLPFLIDGKASYLPTDENIATMTSVNEKGEVVVVKTLFNPLTENVGSIVNKSFAKVKLTLELKMLGTIYYVGNYLLTEVVNKEGEITDLDVVKFSSLITRNKTTAKKVIDQTTLDNWSKLYTAITNKYINKKYVNFKIIRGGEIDGIKFNKTGTIEFPFAEGIDSIGKDLIYLDVKVQRKDKHNYKSIFEFIAGSEEKVMDGISIGSLNKLAPSVHVLLSMYNKLYDSLNEVTETMLSKENSDISDKIKSIITLKPLSYDVSNLSNIIDNLETELRRVPTEVAVINKSKNELTENLNRNMAKQEFKPIVNNTVPQQSLNNVHKVANNKRDIVVNKPDFRNPGFVKPNTNFTPVSNMQIQQQTHTMQQPYQQQQMMQHQQQPVPQQQQYKRPMQTGYRPPMQQQRQQVMSRPMIGNQQRFIKPITHNRNIDRAPWE